MYLSPPVSASSSGSQSEQTLEVDWSALDPRQTPRLHPETQREETQLVRLGNDSDPEKAGPPCYICGRNTLFFLNFPALKATKTEGRKEKYGLSCCIACCRRWKLVEI